MASKKPTTIGFSCGDPNGIGAEILVKVFQDNRMFREATPVFYGTPNLIEAAIERVGDPEVNWAVVEGADKAKADQVNVVNIQEEPWDIQWGQVTVPRATSP